MQRRLATLVLAILVFFLLFSQFAAASDQWPMYQANPSHTGYISVSLAPDKFSLRWEKKLGSLALNPATAAGGRVFVSQSGYFGKQGIYTLKSSSGEECWSKVFDDVFSVNPPSYADGKVYVQTGNHSDDTYLRAYDAAAGTLIFRSSHEAQWERYYAPTIYRGKVYVNGGYFGGMYAFDGKSGKQEWFYDLPQYDGWTPAVDENNAYAYVGEYQPGLYVVNRLTGQLSFKITDPEFDWNGWSMDQAPVLGGSSDAFAIHNGRLIQFDLDARKLGWVKTENFSGQPTIANGIIYAINAGALGAYDQKTGDLLWMWEALNGNLKGTIVVTNSHLFATTDSTTYCIDLASHREVWSYPLAGHLSLGESTLYIASSNGTLSAIGLGLPDLFVTETLTFDIAEFGESLTEAITLSNVGDAPLNVRSLKSSSEEFEVLNLALPLTLQPHSSIVVDVKFTPSATGTRKGRLRILSNDPNEPGISVGLTGRSYIFRTIKATAGEGGEISPSGNNQVINGDDINFTITPNPGFRIYKVIVDKVLIGQPSSYTFTNVTKFHSIIALFCRDTNYFGIQAGNSQTVSIAYSNGTPAALGSMTVDENLSASSYIITQTIGTKVSKTKVEQSAAGLGIKEIQNQQGTISFTNPLLSLKKNIKPGLHWTSQTGGSASGASISAILDASVSATALVRVPAGYFLAFPIQYTLKVIRNGQMVSDTWTEYFVPYIGTIKSINSTATVRVQRFTTNAGTVRTPPPIVRKATPSSASPGTQIKITGYQFGAAQGSGRITVGGVNVTDILSWSDNAIMCIVPEGVTAGNITVFTKLWSSNRDISVNIGSK